MSDSLKFSGERFTPECVREMWYEHYHRYVFAGSLVENARVLDAACGEGYGSALLAQAAGHVTGLDISGDAVSHARKRYQQYQNLDFVEASCTDLPFDDASFDAVISFETLEHLIEQEAMLAEFSRVLKPEGFLLISSPDKANYSDALDYENPFHVRELYFPEFKALISEHFSSVKFLQQKLLFQSAIWASENPASVSATVHSADALLPGLKFKPVYHLAVAARTAAAIPALDSELYLFSDEQESVYAHYNHEIRKNMSAGGVINELKAEIDSLTSQVEALKAPDRYDRRPADTEGPVRRLLRRLGFSRKKP